MAHGVAGAKNLADRNAVGAVGGQHIQHACWQTCSYRQFGRRQRGQRCELGRFDDDGTTRCQSRRNFAGDHGQGEIPRRDGGAHTNGLLQHHETAVVVKLRQGFAIHTFGFFGIPLNKTGAVRHFAFGLGVGLALFGSKDTAQIFHVRHQQVIPLAQQNAAFFGGFVAPSGPSGVSGGDGAGGFLGAEVGHIGQFAPVAGVEHIKALQAFDPFAVDQRIGFQQAGVFE